jgi:hypothetical protein
VGEEAPDDHVAGVALRGLRELVALAHRGQAARGARCVDHAQQSGAAILEREGGGEVGLMRTRRRTGGGRDDEEEKRRGEALSEGFPAAHVGEGARGPAC